MVNLTFKNVGQGDSVVIEWNDNGDEKVAVVDCNLYLGHNPVLNHIVDRKYETIEFLLLSHPHKDHYSGFKNLIEHCRSQGIKIYRFLHTAKISPDYLMSINSSNESDKILFKLFDLLKTMRENGEIETFGIEAIPELVIPIGREFSIKVLAPTARDEDNFIRNANYPFDEEGDNGRPNANWLCTLLVLFHNESKNYVVLSSDVKGEYLNRIKGDFKDTKLVLGQVPHHGSKSNLFKPFWQNRKRSSSTPVVISVGKNNYSHPSDEVITFFHTLQNYVLYTTANNLSSTSSSIEDLLDVFSEEIITEAERAVSDRSFSINHDSAVLI